ncbi:hypothetical protein PspR76_19555 [Pseudomonas sp. R76]|nr:hypothetical protein PspR76_19555 [Pseudomonas sp. R76]
MIVPTLRVGMPHWTLCVRSWDAERPWLHSHAERGNDQSSATPPPDTDSSDPASNSKTACPCPSAPSQCNRPLGR